MNILIIPSWYPIDKTSHGGSFFREQAIALQTAGHNVIVLNASFSSRQNWSNPNNFRIMKSIDKGVTIYSFVNPLFGLGRLSIIKNLIYTHKLKYLLKLLRRNRIAIDIVHAHSFFSAGYASTKLRKILKVPIVITEHSSEIVFSSLSKYKKRCLEESVSKSSQFICVSEFLKQKVENLINMENEIVVIPNMVSPLFIRDQHLKTNKKFTFLSVGNLNEGKRFKLTIQAFNKAFHNNKSVILQIVGGGPQYDYLKEYVASLNMVDSIKILGPKSREETATLMKQCDVFVLPSAFETFGVVYIEALACGKPVIAARNGGAEYIITDKNGILIDIDNLPQLVESMIFMYTNAINYDSVLISKECLKQYSHESIVNELLNIYTKVIKEG